MCVCEWTLITRTEGVDKCRHGNKQEPVEGRQRETKADKPGNHVVTKSVSLEELRPPSAEEI